MIPVTEDESGKLKFKICNLKTVLSYSIWFVVPSVCSICQAVLTSVTFGTSTFLKNFNINNLATMSLTTFSTVLPFILPGMMGNLVEKSMLDLETITRPTQNLISILAGIIIVGVNMLPTFFDTKLSQMENFEIIRVIYLIKVAFLTFEILSFLMLLQTISQDFQCKMCEARNTEHVEFMASKQLEIVEGFRKMKTGFSPMLFVTISLFGSTALMLFYSFKSSVVYGYSMPILNLTTGFCFFAILYAITSQCDCIYKAFHSNKSKLR